MMTPTESSFDEQIEMTKGMCDSSTDCSLNFLTPKWIIKRFNNSIKQTSISAFVDLLKTVGKHEGIISFEHLCVKYGKTYLFFERMPNNFENIFKSEIIVGTISNEHCIWFAKKLLEALLFLHTHNIIHGYLSKDCIWVNEDCDLKIMDYCEHNLSISEHGRHLSPEWCYDDSRVATKELDIWDAGVFLSQLNNSGKDTYPKLEVMNAICKIVEMIGLSDHFPASAKIYYLKMYPDWIVPTVKISCNPFLTENAECFDKYWDFLRNMLQYKEKRFTAEQLLAHSYLTAIE
jgi:serine/threonine protein kinase